MRMCKYAENLCFCHNRVSVVVKTIYHPERRVEFYTSPICHFERSEKSMKRPAYL